MRSANHSRSVSLMGGSLPHGRLSYGVDVALLSPDLMRMLAPLAFGSRRRVAGKRGGERRSPRRGQSQEFADHRPYVPGDDLRYLDWHLYGRLDALWIKLFEEEDDRTVQLLLDCSASMEGVKLQMSRRLAAALSWIALGRSDRVAVASLSDRLASYAPPRRGRGAAAGVFRTLEEVRPGGDTDLVRALGAYPRQRGAGWVLLFTDFLYAHGPDEALRRLRATGADVHAFHVLSPADLRPDLDGDVVLIDAETGAEMAMTVDEGVLERYQATVLAWADEMRLTCERLGVGYTRLDTRTPIERLVLGELRRQGLVG